MKREIAYSVGGLVIGVGVLFTTLAAIPWANKEDVKDNTLKIESLYALKIQDNLWYSDLDGEMRERMTRMEVNQINMKEDLKEIKLILRGR